MFRIQSVSLRTWCRFHELAVLLDKDHPKAEKAGIVIDAAKMIKALKEEVRRRPLRLFSVTKVQNVNRAILNTEHVRRLTA